MQTRVGVLSVLSICIAVLLCTAAEKRRADKQAGEPSSALRSRARQDFTDGNYRNAAEMYRKLVLDPQDDSRAVGGDLTAAIETLKKLKREEEIDGFREEAVRLHAKNWRLLHAAAHSLADGSHYGRMIAGVFHRGVARGEDELVNSEARARVRALQLMKQALPLVGKEPDRQAASEFDLDLAGILRNGRNDAAAWKLQVLTDLSKLPDYEPGGAFGLGFDRGAPQGAPVDSEGRPILYYVPSTFELAKSDGERWRWALAQAVVDAPSRKHEIALRWADFLRSQFGVQTMRGFVRPLTLSDNNETGPFAVHTLKDDETIARLATGIKRFKLPDEFDFIRIDREVAASSDRTEAEQALMTLAGIFEDRRQYPKAAEMLRECIRRFGPGDDNQYQDQLDQIVGNWGRFESTKTQPALAGRVLGFRFRNGKRLDLEAHALRVETLLRDVKAYLKSNPQRLVQEKVDLDNLGLRIVQKNEAQYLGKRVAQWSVPLDPSADHFDRHIDVAVPVQKGGAYLVTARMEGGNTSRIVIWIADTVIVHKRLNGGLYYLVADAVTGKPIADANVELFTYRQNSLGGNRYQVLTSNFAERTDADGQIVLQERDVDPGAMCLAIARTKSGGFAFLGFENLSLSRFDDSSLDLNKAFVVTDRPVYRPGQSVKFKFWIRRVRYDGPDKCEFAGQSFKIRITDSMGNKPFEKTFKADSQGGFDGEFPLPSDATLGNYQLSVVDPRDIDGAGSFRVEEYKKPEFEVKVEAPTESVALGDRFAATIKANYYFGGPVTKATVHYKVTRSSESASWYPFDEWDWCYGAGYWWFWPDSTWYPGWESWGGHGPSRDWWTTRSNPPPEIVLDATVPIGADGMLKIEVDTALAKTLHADLDHRYEITAEVTDQSRRTIDGTGEVLVARKPFEVFTWTDRGYYRVGDPIEARFEGQTADHKPVQGTGVAALYRVTYNAGAKPTETVVQTWKVNTNKDGEARLMMHASQAGQYRVAYKLTDSRKRTIEGALLLTVVGEGFDGSQFRFNDLEIIADKRTYRPGEKVRLLINTNRVGSTVFLFVRTADGIYPKPQILRLAGKSIQHEIEVVQGDMPNFFVEALTISNGRLFSEAREIVVPPEKRVLKVAIRPSARDFKPGSDAAVHLKLTDLDGKPVVGSAALTVYDKSVEYISGGSNVPEIREFFWGWRRSYERETSSSLDRESQNIVGPKDMEMVRLGVFGGLLNGDADEIEGVGGGMFGGAMGMGMGGMGGAMGGFALDGGRAAKSAENRVYMAAPQMPMYANARAASASETKPEVQPAVRSQFADTAFWSARLESNKDGLASVSFKMPENLTTWKVRVWSVAGGTRVGQGEAEIVTTKNLLVRMQAPRFFVEKDEVVLSAIVHNHLKTQKSVRVVLKLAGKELSAIDAPSKTIEIAAGGEARVDWRVKAVQHGEATVRMKALSDEESDAVEMHFPVRVHGMLKMDSFAGSIRPDRESASFSVTVPSQRRIDETRLEIRYSPTLAGALVDALPYLATYPHETTDCTLNRFLPTVMVQNVLNQMHLDLAAIKNKRANLNAQELGDPQKRAAGWKRFKDNPVFDNAEVTRMSKVGVRGLTDMQLADGGWGWFSGWYEHSEPHMTALVIHGLQLAQQNGVALVPETLEKGIAWLRQYQAEQVRLLKRYRPGKQMLADCKVHTDNSDALVYMVLVDAGVNERAMQDFLYRDRTELSVYAKGLFGLALSALKAEERLAMVMQNIDQFLVQDDENQTAYLKLPDGSCWWCWYDSETEANAYYLKLLARRDPQGEKASRLAKYLLNNRKHATYWNSPRDTAVAIEALSEYVLASKQDWPEMTVEVYVDGKKVKEVAINRGNLFTFDDRVTLLGAAVASGPHKVELRKRGAGPLYFNAYLTNFSLEDFISRSGLEIRVDRNYYKLVRADEGTNAAGTRGQVISERTEKYRRIAIPNLGEVQSGDLIEIELTIDSKNDYEHIIFEDPKAAGLEPFDVQSGYNADGLGAYVELRDEKVTLFVRTLARGKHSLRYRMRAEIPGRYCALPTKGSAMYAPELQGNSDELRLLIRDSNSSAD